VEILNENASYQSAQTARIHGAILPKQCDLESHDTSIHARAWKGPLAEVLGISVGGGKTRDKWQYSREEKSSTPELVGLFQFQSKDACHLLVETREAGEKQRPKARGAAS
jgi:hypothetical protein